MHEMNCSCKSHKTHDDRFISIYKLLEYFESKKKFEPFYILSKMKYLLKSHRKYEPFDIS